MQILHAVMLGCPCPPLALVMTKVLLHCPCVLGTHERLAHLTRKLVLVQGCRVADRTLKKLHRRDANFKRSLLILEMHTSWQQRFPDVLGMTRVFEYV